MSARTLCYVDSENVLAVIHSHCSVTPQREGSARVCFAWRNSCLKARMKGLKVTAPHKQWPSVISMSPECQACCCHSVLRGAAGRGSCRSRRAHKETRHTVQGDLTDVCTVLQRTPNVSRCLFQHEGNNAALVTPVIHDINLDLETICEWCCCMFELLQGDMRLRHDALCKNDSPMRLCSF